MMFLEEHHWESNPGLPICQNMLLYYILLQNVILNPGRISLPINLHTEISGISLKLSTFSHWLVLVTRRLNLFIGDTVSREIFLA